MDEAVIHCTRGAGIWEWASNDAATGAPDVVMACRGGYFDAGGAAAVTLTRSTFPTSGCGWSTSLI